MTGLGTFGFLSTLTVTTANINSTVTGLGTSGYLSTLTVTTDNLNSTVTGLGTFGYVSSLSNVLYSSTFVADIGQLNVSSLSFNFNLVRFDQYGNLLLSYQNI